MNTQNSNFKIIGNYQYQMQHCLGEGAFGKVYEGLDSRTNQRVAIKKLDLKDFFNDKYLKSSLQSEIQILKQLSHPNIVKFNDLITTSNSVYIITEFCKDGDLRQYLQRVHKISEEISLTILHQMLQGFKELIKQNIIHRDLKPANILINENTFKIADFGFAKVVNYSNESLLLRSCVGSPLYMAPQVLSKQPYQASKSDIWSLGIIYYEMLFGDVPWKGRDERDLLNNIKTLPLKIPPSAKLTKISETFLLKTLQLQEKDRIAWDEIFQLVSLPPLTSPPLEPKPNMNFYLEKDKKLDKPLKMHTEAQKSNELKENPKLRKTGIFDALPPPKETTNLKNLQTHAEQLMGKRNFVILKHFICTELKLSYLSFKSFLQSEQEQKEPEDDLLLERVLYLLSFQVRYLNKELLKSIELYQSNPEALLVTDLRTLKNEVIKEQEYYEDFFAEYDNILSDQKVLSNIKQNFIFIQNDQHVDYTTLCEGLNEFLFKIFKKTSEIFRTSSKPLAKQLLMALEFLLDIFSLKGRELESISQEQRDLYFSSKQLVEESSTFQAKLRQKLLSHTQTSFFAAF